MVEMESWRKGPWTPEEDKLLTQYVSLYGEGRWSSVSKCAGLLRNGKSCRLRWVNYLKPGLKKGHLTPQEEGIIIELHALWGNKWSTIARYLPGRTDNEIKNYWRTHFKKRKPSPRKILKQREKETYDNNIFKESPQAADEYYESDDKTNVRDMETTYNHPRVEKNQDFLPMICSQETESWSDFIPDDSYLWDGLWNIGDQANNIANYSCEGDTTCYTYNGRFIF
ncbi:hypothetical protein BUALT_Bualt16G0024000 [Buddleja alternifolia]|uniref:Uncharacterized protein n=1 Tax=Buddleja alternifolia TaxID=168488 RepID=A0AAV6W8E6_9LAMI|nr:hypothetical protein BUALT_Bualt16G0024000 [Buddleja alternifolia]